MSPTPPSRAGTLKAVGRALHPQVRRGDRRVQIPAPPRRPLASAGTLSESAPPGSLRVTEFWGTSGLAVALGDPLTGASNGDRLVVL